MKRFSLIFLLCILLLHTYGYDSKNIYYGQLKNKSTMVVLKDTSRSNTLLNLYIKTSPAFEHSNNAGVTRVLSYLILNNIIKLDSSYSNSTVQFFDEYTMFSFPLPDKEIEIERILSNIYRPILIDSGTINSARISAQLSYTVGTPKNLMLSEFEEKINRAMWSNYIYKKAQTDTNNSIKTLSYKDLKTYYDRYFKSYYSLVVIKGKFDAQDKFLSINENILYDESLNSTYIPISTINIYNNLTTSSQLVFFDSAQITPNKVQISYQLASNYQDNNGYVKATIIEELINYYRHQLFDSIGINDFELHTKLYKNATTYNLSYTSSINEKEQFYQLISILKAINFNSIINGSRLIDLLKLVLGRYNLENRSTNTLEENIVENWSINRIEDFFTYDKKVKNINVDDLVDFYSKYIKDRPFVASVIKSKNSSDELFEVDESFVKNTEVFYDYNLADITHESEIEKLSKVLQWMKINPTIYLQVNGYADKNEYLKVTSSEVDSFVIKYPKFNLISSFKAKNTWKRLDMFRAIKICKYLIENGVDPDRLSGSGILINSDDRDLMYKNQKVTFTTFITR